jgi:hypothetical protein
MESESESIRVLTKQYQILRNVFGTSFKLFGIPIILLWAYMVTVKM